MSDQPPLRRDPVNGNFTFDILVTAHSKVYTAYVKYTYDTDDPETKGFFIEEIDVTAKSREEASAVAEAALAQEYEPGGEITEVREQLGMYF